MNCFILEGRSSSSESICFKIIGFCLRITNKLFLIFMETVSRIFRNWKNIPFNKELENSSLLVIRHGGIGDLLFITPILKELKFKYPSLRITLMARIAYHELFEGFPYIDNLINHAWPNIFSLFRHDYILFLDKSIETDKEAKYVNIYDLFSKYAGIILKDDQKIPVIFRSKSSMEYIESIFPLKPKTKVNIGIHVRAGSPVRTPSISFMVKLITEILNRISHVRIFLLDDKHHSNYVNKIINKILPYCNIYQEVYNFASFTRNIQDLVALVSKMDLIVAPDSSVIHIAAAFSISSIGIYGPFPSSLRVKYYPNNISFDAPSDCAPCFTHGHKPCSKAQEAKLVNSPCFEKLDVKKIVDSVELLLRRKRKRPLVTNTIVCKFQRFIDNEDAYNLWKKIRKVYIISPARSCSTILMSYLNVHPKIKIFNEPRLDKAFIKNYSSLDRLAHFSGIDEFSLKELLEYYHCNSDRVEFSDIIGFLFWCNPFFRKMIKCGVIIGGKDPFLSRMINDQIKLVEYLAQKDDWKFIGIIKTKAYQILPSIKRLLNNHPERYLITNYSKDMLYYAQSLVQIAKKYSLIEKKRLLLRSYDEFLDMKKKLIDEFVKFILGSNEQFNIYEMDDKTIINYINCNLRNPWLGSLNFIYNIKEGLAKHHVSLVGPIADMNIGENAEKYLGNKEELETLEHALNILQSFIETSIRGVE